MIGFMFSSDISEKILPDIKLVAKIVGFRIPLHSNAIQISTSSGQNPNSGQMAKRTLKRPKFKDFSPNFL